ncbi:hypothetical protein [Moraxella canis]|nr:hypothetical protein [Moraxella canis]
MKEVINKVLELTSAGYLLTQQPLTDSQQVMPIHSMADHRALAGL